MECLLNDAVTCIQCGECTKCDLDANKLCDNCMRCLKSDADYLAVEIDEIIEDDEMLERDAEEVDGEAP